MRVNFNDPNPGIWVNVDDKKPEEGRICLRVMNDDKLKELERNHTKPKKELFKGRIHESVETDWDSRDRDFWDYVIVDWEGIEAEDGNEIPCKAENKFFLMRKNPDFSTFISEMLDKLREQKAERKEAAEKN